MPLSLGVSIKKNIEFESNCTLRQKEIVIVCIKVFQAFLSKGAIGWGGGKTLGVVANFSNKILEWFIRNEQTWKSSWLLKNYSIRHYWRILPIILFDWCFTARSIQFAFNVRVHTVHKNMLLNWHVLTLPCVVSCN